MWLYQKVYICFGRSFVMEFAFRVSAPPPEMQRTKENIGQICLQNFDFTMKLICKQAPQNYKPNNVYVIIFFVWYFFSQKQSIYNRRHATQFGIK